MSYLPTTMQAFAFCLCLTLTACTGNEASADAEGAAQEMEEMTPKYAMEEGQQLASYEWLKGYLPAQVGAQKTVSTKGELTNMMGYKVSRAQANYGSATTIAISDVGLTGTDLGKLGAWINADLAEVDGESFERTTAINNTYRTLEKYNADSETATVSVMVAERFLITATSDRAFGVDALKAAIAGMDLNKLANAE